MNFSRFKAANTLMVQGCTSDAGKTVMVAGLGRLLKRRGLKVAPFKPQNMALNSAVTKDGGEIGRAQALQALACGVEPQIDFNPILLKPASDVGAQVIVHGQAVQNMQASGYHDYKKVAMRAVLDSFNRLQLEFENIVVEGAGSPAEINLREGDIANMGFAEAVDCPVVLIADIDRGGVFAHLVGTLDLLSNTEQNRVIGFIINRFRGDIALLEPGLDWLEKRTGKPVLGVVPYLHDLYLDAEDAISSAQASSQSQQLTIAVPVLPRISNHTDFDSLRLNPAVNLVFTPANQPPPAADLIILPGSKNVIDDLSTLRKSGWPQGIERHLRYGGKVIGICGGYQMLGHRINDPHGIENNGQAQTAEGLGLLDCETELLPQKQLTVSQGQLCHPLFAGQAVNGYEIHCGQTTSHEQPVVKLQSKRYDGAMNEDQSIMGSYLHGLFDTPSSCRQILAWAGLNDAPEVDIQTIRENQLNRLADCLDEHLNERLLDALIQPSTVQA